MDIQNLYARIQPNADHPPIVTIWTRDPDEECDAELKEERDRLDSLFRQRVVDLLRSQPAWFTRMLQCSKASIVAGPGRLFVYFNNDVNDFAEIPELGSQLSLMPWREPNEANN